MKSTKERIAELKQFIEYCEIVLKIHLENKILKDDDEFKSYADSVLDEINEAKKEIKMLENK